MKKLYLFFALIVFAAALIFSQEVLYNETEVSFESNGFKLYATLTVPANSGKEFFPAVVMVHGSGANDRDESLPVAQNIVIKPFMNIAHELAKAGIASLRYDKRNFTIIKENLLENGMVNVYPQDFIDDARAAFGFLRSTEHIDKNRIFFIGHSEGASYAPFICKDKEFAGAVLLAPGLERIDIMVIKQLELLISIYTQNNINNQYQAYIDQYTLMRDALKSQFDLLQNGSISEDDYIMGATPEYFRRWKKLTENTPQDIASMTIPVLIINGTADMKCPVQDLISYESTLKKNKDLEIYIIDNMIHELIDQQLNFEYKITEKIIQWIL